MRRNYVRALGAVGSPRHGSRPDARTPGRAATRPDCGGKIAHLRRVHRRQRGSGIPSRTAPSWPSSSTTRRTRTARSPCRSSTRRVTPTQATPVANQIAQRPVVPRHHRRRFSGESKATMPIYEAAGLAMISPSATRAEPDHEGQEVFHRVVGNDGTQGVRRRPYIKDVRRREGLRRRRRQRVRRGPRRRGKKASAPRGRRRTRSRTADHFAATITKIKAVAARTWSSSAATPRGRSAAEAAPRRRLSPAKFVGRDGVNDPASRGRRRRRRGRDRDLPVPPGRQGQGHLRRRLQEASSATRPGSYGDEGLRRGEDLPGGLQGRQDHPRRHAGVREGVRQAGRREVPQVRRQGRGRPARSSSGPTRSRARRSSRSRRSSSADDTVTGVRPGAEPPAALWCKEPR